MGQAIRGRAEEESAGWIVEEGEAGKNTMKRDQCEPFCSRSRVHARYKVLYPLAIHQSRRTGFTRGRFRCI